MAIIKSQSYPVHDCFKPLWISLELILDSRLAIYTLVYNSEKMWLTLKFAELVLAIDVVNADRFKCPDATSSTSTDVSRSGQSGRQDI